MLFRSSSVGFGADGLPSGGAGGLETGKSTGEHPEPDSKIPEPPFGFFVVDGEGDGDQGPQEEEKEILN